MIKMDAGVIVIFLHPCLRTIILFYHTPGDSEKNNSAFCPVSCWQAINHYHKGTKNCESTDGHRPVVFIYSPQWCVENAPYFLGDCFVAKSAPRKDMSLVSLRVPGALSRLEAISRQVGGGIASSAWRPPRKDIPYRREWRLLRRPGGLLARTFLASGAKQSPSALGLLRANALAKTYLESF